MKKLLLLLVLALVSHFTYAQQSKSKVNSTRPHNYRIDLKNEGTKELIHLDNKIAANKNNPEALERLKAIRNEMLYMTKSRNLGNNFLLPSNLSISNPTLLGPNSKSKEMPTSIRMSTRNEYIMRAE